MAPRLKILVASIMTFLPRRSSPVQKKEEISEDGKINRQTDTDRWEVAFKAYKVIITNLESVSHSQPPLPLTPVTNMIEMGEWDGEAKTVQNMRTLLESTGPTIVEMRAALQNIQSRVDFKTEQLEKTQERYNQILNAIRTAATQTEQVRDTAFRTSLFFREEGNLKADSRTLQLLQEEYNSCERGMDRVTAELIKWADYIAELGKPVPLNCQSPPSV